ncbi:cell division protein FtsQ/DivIB [Marinomonas sp. C2222]|uniref:Cell division protein FtsQ n=1 Tax=Marinomonas sargassi TaxID=2984494 RepID=A0ABT2YT58_9GAMM|nr:cell division protein FtsQ/DivIB [Marinomonas sargassi]MCV2403080.1 cell division protein FtsQ/DivIB [Marinomonas sargassi]
MRIAALLGAILLIAVASLQNSDIDSWFAINEIEIKGDLLNVTEAELQGDFSSLLDRSLLDLSLQDSLGIILASEWVESAEVRKVWPNKLQVLVREYSPLAYWREGQLVSTTAVVFSPKMAVDLPLPHLHGPEGASDIVLEQFGLISQVLASTSLRVSSLILEARGAWTVTFSNGIPVKLGREQVLDRLQRFIAVYNTDLSGRIEQVFSVDARYPHGVAVAWKE